MRILELRKELYESYDVPRITYGINQVGLVAQEHIVRVQEDLSGHIQVLQGKVATLENR